MKLSKKIGIAVFFIAIVMGLNHICYAGTQRLNSIDYDVQLNKDGSMNIDYCKYCYANFDEKLIDYHYAHHNPESSLLVVSA